MRFKILAALLYPLSTVTIAAGFLALVMIVFNIDVFLIGTVVLWFYFFSTVTIYAISKEALKAMGFNRFYVGFMVTIGVLATLALLLLLLGLRG